MVHPVGIHVRNDDSHTSCATTLGQWYSTSDYHAIPRHFSHSEHYAVGYSSTTTSAMGLVSSGQSILDVPTPRVYNTTSLTDYEGSS